jgi:predicted aspartyl protease
MRTTVLTCCLAACVSICWAQAGDLQALYKAHNWVELSEHLQHAQGASLYRGAIGITFNQDPERIEELLLSVINAAPHSSEAYDASEWLSHLYFYRGQYRRLIAIMERRWAAFPEKKENSQEQAAVQGFRGLPDQAVVSTRPSKLSHDPESIFIPVSIEGQTVNYFFDTGAWISCMSESEARRLRLVIRNSAGTMGQTAGAQVAFRTAVAKDVIIGNSHFKDVSFAVFPDNQEPWSDLATGRRGIIGIPLLVGLRTLLWKTAGNMAIAEPSQPFDIRNANLAFDNDHLVVRAIIDDRNVGGTVDTGATRTDLYRSFANTFPTLIKQYSKKDSTDVHGVGHAEKFDSLTLPRVGIRIGDFEATLSPAHVIMKSMGADCCVGNFGLDLFKQASALKLDFGAMTLELGADSKVE